MHGIAMGEEEKRAQAVEGALVPSVHYEHIVYAGALCHAGLTNAMVAHYIDTVTCLRCINSYNWKSLGPWYDAEEAQVVAVRGTLVPLVHYARSLPPWPGSGLKLPHRTACNRRTPLLRTTYTCDLDEVTCAACLETVKS